ncbi:MAG TPA: DUF72 domain-containing protein [Caulobacteraceae bacterium]|nr:DUF72 domain-containing protein [Caulobacteraceae bacterium]
MTLGAVRVGVGGWTFEPWRGAFYPQGLKHADELAFASRRLTALEINATYYSRQSPKTFASWAAQTPEGFVFTLKGGRACTNRKVLAEAGESVRRFVEQGIDALGDKLGPILWQFMHFKRFDRDEFAAFVDFLPPSVSGLKLRHCLEVRHRTFADPAFVELCRQRNIAICLSDEERWPLIADATADFTYARLQRGVDEVPTAYEPAEIRAWAKRLSAYASGGFPDDLKPVAEAAAPAGRRREVFAFFISGGKARAPMAAEALISALQQGAA